MTVVVCSTLMQITIHADARVPMPTTTGPRGFTAGSSRWSTRPKKRLSSAGEEDSSAGELGSSNAAQNESEEGAPTLKRPHVAGRRTSHMRKEECGAELAAAGLSTEGTTLQLRSRVAEHRQSMKSPKER